MIKKDKAINLIEKICKSKDFREISKLREDLNFILDKVEEDKVRAYLKKQSVANTKISVY